MMILMNIFKQLKILNNNLFYLQKFLNSFIKILKMFNLLHQFLPSKNLIILKNFNYLKIKNNSFKLKIFLNATKNKLHLTIILQNNLKSKKLR